MCGVQDLGAPPDPSPPPDPPSARPPKISTSFTRKRLPGARLRGELGESDPACAGGG